MLILHQTNTALTTETISLKYFNHANKKRPPFNRTVSVYIYLGN